ncbi:TPA: recombinase RecT, partial [Enterococcus faecalis]
SDEKVQQIQEDGNIISETEVEENTTMKTAEVINEADSDSLNQTDLFDTKNPPLE